ncbi:hypothetical protein M422DRAFT_270776 [Sphaerobolus stellatus SS14]|uniref:Uncharacterized protein n=1 Tax=Sphaerobolus stellatus (strain SS14) TaxID=990650 RepID=A0A0C9TFA9_SPHS4|nr:hypothetical protein M422DRAFT_270776 [Sphaerobolus stellatus SS14]
MTKSPSSCHPQVKLYIAQIRQHAPWLSGRLLRLDAAQSSKKAQEKQKLDTSQHVMIHGRLQSPPSRSSLLDSVQNPTPSLAAPHEPPSIVPGPVDKFILTFDGDDDEFRFQSMRDFHESAWDKTRLKINGSRRWWGVQVWPKWREETLPNVWRTYLITEARVFKCAVLPPPPAPRADRIPTCRIRL